jgi:hypothetical protein
MLLMALFPLAHTAVGQSKKNATLIFKQKANFPHFTEQAATPLATERRSPQGWRI